MRKKSLYIDYGADGKDTRIVVLEASIVAGDFVKKGIFFFYLIHVK